MKGVSVIICCYNSTSRLLPTLQHLQNQKYTQPVDWELIIVDNASTDDTAKVAQEIWNENPVTRMLSLVEKKPGLMSARLLGAANARYDFISFIDDDNWVEEYWVDKVYTILNKDPMIGGCGGRTEAIFEAAPPPWFHYFQTSFAIGKQQASTGYINATRGFLWGAGLSIKKEILNRLLEKGFRSYQSGRTGTAMTAGDDSELCLAIRLCNFQLWYDENLLLYHFIPKPRLKFDTLINMHKGFGKAEVVLSIYRKALNPEHKIKANWLWESVAMLKSLPLFFIKNFFSRGDNKIKLKSEFSFRKGYLNEMFRTRKQYNTIKAQIQNLSLKVATMNPEKIEREELAVNAGNN